MLHIIDLAFGLRLAQADPEQGRKVALAPQAQPAKPATPQTPSTTAGQPPAPTPEAPPTETYTYQPEGRRDPFVSLVGTGTEPHVTSKRGDGAAGMTLAEISVRGIVQSRGEPVAYIATRPDPLTVVLDFRNVATGGVASATAANAKSPIAAVSVEPDDSLGAPGSRVRIELTQPVAHRVRSDRNTVVVDFDKPSADGALYVRPARSAAPDAMLALAPDNAAGKTNSAAASVEDRKSSQPQPIQDPITALGLNKHAAAPQTAGARTIQPPTPPVPTPGDTTQPVSPQAGRRYQGHPISLDFQGADLRAVLRTFAEISGLNIVIEPAVQGTVDVALRDVPWDQALDIILRANKLGYIVDGTIVRIAPLSVLADEQSQQRKPQEEQALAGELRVLTKTLSYAKAEELQALLTKSALSQRGTVQIDPRTNTLIITDLRDRLTL